VKELFIHFLQDCLVGKHMRENKQFRRYYFSILVLVLLSLLNFSYYVSGADDPYTSGGTSGVGYYMGEYVSDTIPSSLEAGSSYPVVITFRNNGMVSWEWGVEKFGLLYQGLQSSISVDPVFSPIPEGMKVATQEVSSFPFTLTPPDKPGEYELSFSMSTRKGEDRYTPFPNGFSKKITVIPKEGVSSGSVGSIIIQSTPSGALVRMGNEDKGFTPLTLPDLNPAQYEISVSHPDYSSKWTQVMVEPGAVSRVQIDLTSQEKPSVSTEHLLKYTTLGWILDNLPLIIISAVIIFLGFQVIMMDTQRIPEQHPIRRYTRPLIMFAPSADGKNRFQRGVGDRGKGNQAGENESVSGKSDAGWNKKGGKTSGSGIGGQKVIMDRSIRRGGSDSDKKPIETENSIPDIQVEDPEQESKEIEGMWGFPHSLRDRYEPLGVAGDDSYARVYKVRKKESGALRALKVGHLKQPGSEILQKETAVWRSLRHPNIVHLFRSEFLDDMTFLENEYLEGLSYKGSLHTSLSGLPKPIREQYAVSLVRDIAEGLRYAHEIGVRHYHLQTGDILITPKLRAKISGFARGRNEFGFSIKDSDVRNATATYITPEQKNETIYGNPGRRTDIYQLGVIFYELLTGFLPYSPEAFKKSGREGLYEEYKDELILPSEIRKNLVKYDPILLRMLSRKKSGRYDYMDEFIADLDALSRPKPVE